MQYGHPVGSGYSLHCEINPNWCHPAGVAPTPAAGNGNDVRSAAERAAEEKQEVERAQRAAEAKRIEQEAARRAQERSEKLARDRDEALHELRGPSSRTAATEPSAEIRGTGDSAFGIKPVRDTAIQDVRPAASSRALGSTLANWKRLNYAFAITQKIASRMNTKGVRNLDSSDLAEISYLGTEALRALHGEHLGIVVEVPLPPHIENAHGSCVEASGFCHGELEKALAASESNLRKLVSTAVTLERLRAGPSSPAGTTTKPTTTADSQKTVDPKQVAPPQTSPADQQIAEAYAKQKAWQRNDSLKIKTIYEEQQQNDLAMQKALAAMLAIQRALNQSHSARQTPRRGTSQ